MEKIKFRMMVAACFAAAGFAFGADLVWSGGVGDAWNGANWGGGYWATGSRAVFNTDAEVNVTAATGQVGGFAFNGNVTLAGSGQITLSSNAISVGADKTAVISAPLAGTVGLNKTGDGTLRVENPSFSGNVVTGGGTLIIAEPEGRELSINLNDGGAIVNNLAFEGPGRINISKRVYINNVNKYVNLGNHLVFTLSTQNAANNGLIVSGNNQCVVNLGDCTLITSKAGSPVSLLRCVTLNFNGTDTGTTISTSNTSGQSITIQTLHSTSEVNYFTGEGPINFIGGGVFTFDSPTVFNNTGLITVADGVTAILKTDVANAPFLLKNGGTLQFNGKYPQKRITVEHNGVLDLGAAAGTLNFAEGVEFKDGSVLRMAVGTSMPVLGGKDVTAWTQFRGMNYPVDGKVTISPSAGAGFGPGRYTLIADIATCGLSAFRLDTTSLSGYNLALDRDGNALVLVVASDSVPGWSVWTGPIGAAWSGENWDGGSEFPEGCGARFETAGSSVALDASATARALAFNASATVSGAETLTLTHGDINVAAGVRAVLDVPLATDGMLRKYGSGTLVVNAGKSTPVMTPNAYAGQIELFVNEGESAEVKINSDDSRRTGGITYRGPGTFTSTRFYPRNYSSTNIVEGGATVTFSANNARDGLMVSGGYEGEPLDKYGHVVLGDCTICSAYNVETILCRDVNVVLNDTVNGTTFYTQSPNGTPIRISTSRSGLKNTFSGEGRINITGSGQFLFHEAMTYSNTGMVTVRNGATVQMWKNLPLLPFTIEAGGALNPDSTTAVKSVAFADGAIFMPQLSTGRASYLTVNEGVTWPAEGKVVVRTTGSAALANDTYTLLVNAGADVLSHITLENNIPGKNVELKVEGGNLLAVVTQGEYLDLTWKGGNGAWSDADGWNGDAWIDSAFATIPAAGGTIALADNINLSSLTVLGETTITGNGSINYLATNNVVNVAADTTIAPAFGIPSKGLTKTGAGALNFTGPAQSEGLSLNLQEGSVAWTQPAMGVEAANFTPGTSLGLGGGFIAYDKLNFSAGTNVLRNAAITMSGDTFRTEKGEAQTLILDDGTSVDGTGIAATAARFWVYNGAHVILGVNCGKLSFGKTTASSYVAAADPGKVGRLTILGGELEMKQINSESFGIAARNEFVTGIVHMVSGKLTSTRITMARRWDGGNYNCLGHGELLMDGGVLTAEEFLIGAGMVEGDNLPTGDAVLRFNGGTAVIGAMRLDKFTDRDILFNGTVFKPSTNGVPFMTQVTCAQNERLEIGEGGLIVDTDGRDVGFNLAPGGTGDFTKRGEGTLTMMRDLPATGAVSVETGTLAIDGNRVFAGGGSLAAGATIACGANTLTFGGNLSLAAGSSLSFALNAGMSGGVRAPAIAAAGAFNVALTIADDWHGTAVLLRNLTGVTLDDITVTGLGASASVRLANGSLYVVGADVNAWKGGAGNWSDADGWNSDLWVDGSPALFLTPAGSSVTLGSSVNVAQFGFLESASILSGPAFAGIALGDGTIDVPGGRVVEIAPEITVDGLTKTGAGTLSLGGNQNSLGSLTVDAGTLENAGTIRNLDALAVRDGAKLSFADGSAMTVTGTAELPANALTIAPEATATLAVGSLFIPQNLLVPAGLTVNATTIPYVTVTNNVTSFTVDGTLIDQDQLMIGWVANGTGRIAEGQIYNIAGSGTLRVKELCTRTISWPTFSVKRIESTGGRLYAPSFGTYRFNGSTIAPYGADIEQTAASFADVSMKLLEGGVTFDTLDAADGETARNITLADSNVPLRGEGPLVKINPGTLVLDLKELSYTGATRVEGGTLKVCKPSATSGYTVTGGGTELVLRGFQGEIPSVSLAGGAKLVAGDGTKSTEFKLDRLVCSDNSSLEFIVDKEGGVPIIDLAEATVTSGASVPVRIKFVSQIPNGYYELLLLPPNDDVAFSRYAFTIVNDTGCSAEIVRDAASGVVQLLVGNSSETPLENVWRGRSASGNWTEGLNWQSTDSPLDFVALVFGGERGLTNVNNTAHADFRSLRFEPNAGAFDIDLNGAVVNYITNLAPRGAVMTIRNLHTSADYKQYGTGTVRLVDPIFSNTTEQPDGLNTADTEDNALEIEVSEGNTLNFTSWNNSWNGGKRVFTGKGTVVMNRIYPYRVNCPVVFDGGITAWAKTHNAQTDGLCVSGNVNAYVDFGDCTFGTSFASGVVTLCRYITLNFIDTVKGTTIMTDNIDGNPVTIQTGGGYQGNITFAGAGRINIDGHGTFIFHEHAVFNNTGLITLNAGVSTVVNQGITIPSAPFMVAGTLTLAGGNRFGQPMTVAAGGCLKLLGAAVNSGTTLEAGSRVVLPVGMNWTVVKLVGAITPPASGTAAIDLVCEDEPPVDSAYPLTDGAQLRSGDERKFVVTPTIDGVLCGRKHVQRLEIVDGELVLRFRKPGTMFFLR